MGMRNVVVNCLAQIKVGGNWMVMTPFAGTEPVVVKLKIMSLVRLTIPPWKVIVKPVKTPGAKLVPAIAELLEVSEPMVAMKGLVVSADEGLTIFAKVMST